MDFIKIVTRNAATHAGKVVITVQVESSMEIYLWKCSCGKYNLVFIFLHTQFL